MTVCFVLVLNFHLDLQISMTTLGRQHPHSVLKPSPSPRGAFGLIVERHPLPEKIHPHKPGHRP